jgi:hypothetical protein
VLLTRAEDVLKAFESYCKDTSLLHLESC